MSIDFCDFYFIAIGGVGQSALAKMLLSLGYSVCGSDICESKYTKLVEKMGASVFIGHNSENIKAKCKVVISSAIKEDNPELVKARQLGCEILHRSDCLKIISEQFENFIGFSGTHGKTTTSGMFSFVAKKIGQEISCAIGGIIPQFETNAFAEKNAKYFVAELDESDGTIVKYFPNYLVINNLEADHLDFYKNGIEDIFKTFKKVISNMPEKSKLFLNVDDLGVREFISCNNLDNFISYGIDNNSKYRAKNIVFGDLSSSFDVYKEDVLLGKINLVIPGKHNIYNALSVISVLDEIGYKFSEYAKYFAEFTGMGRRFQLVADINGIKIIDDYAHHPSEIKSTLSAIKNVKRRKIVIFQPHRYTRLKGLWSEFLDSFSDINKLFVLDVFCAGDKPLNDYNSEKFAQEILKKGVCAKYISGNIEQSAQKIKEELSKDDIILTLGAGDITKIGGILNDLLSK